MSSPVAAPRPDVAPLPVPKWAWVVSFLAVAVVYLLLQENGALLANAAEFLHEFTHDGRHALGSPCH